jgi:hypothetical protein
MKMGWQTPKDLNASVAMSSATPAIPPQLGAVSGGTVNGTGVDRATINSGPFASAILAVETGATVGAPTTTTVTAKIQDSADNVSFADYVPPTLAVAPTCVVSAANAANKIGVDLTTARQFVRVTITSAFTGGASPQVNLAAQLLFGGGQVAPLVEP